MKRPKKNPLNRALIQGYRAGIRGHSAEVCPYVDNFTSRGCWFSGWRTGRSEYIAGYPSEPPIRRYAPILILKKN